MNAINCVFHNDVFENHCAKYHDGATQKCPREFGERCNGCVTEQDRVMSVETARKNFEKNNGYDGYTNQPAYRQKGIPALFIKRRFGL